MKKKNISKAKSIAHEATNEALWAVFENMGDGFFACDSDWRFSYINSVAEKVLNIRHEEALGKSHWEVFPLTLGTNLEKEYRRAAAGEVRDFENFYEPWKRWFHNRCFPYNGGMAVYFEEITERKRVEAALLQNEARQRSLIDALGQSNIGLFVVDRNYKVRFMNQMLVEHFGDQSGSTCYHGVGKANQACPYCRLDEVIHKGKTVSYQPVAADGRSYYIVALPYVDIDGEVCKLEIIQDVTERKRAEEELRSTTRLLMETQRMAKIGSWEYDLATGTLSWTPEVYRIFGLDPSTAPTLEGLAKWIHPDDLWAIAPETIEQNTKAGIQEMEYRIIDQTTGEIKYVVGKGETLKDADGRLIKNFGSFQDITQRKQAEVMLRDEQKRLRTILDTVGDPIFVKDNEHRIILANRAFYDIFGMDEESVIGKTLAESVPENERTHFLAVDRQVLDTGVPDLREETLTVGGFTRYIVTKKTRFVEDSGQKFLVGSIHDFTERKQAEEALRKSEEKYRNLYNNAEVAMSRTKLDGSGFVEVNDKLCEIIGYTREELIGRPTPNNWADPSERDEMVRRLKAEGSVKNFEWKLLTKSGAVRNCIANVKLYEEEGVLEGSFLDVTERKRAEEALRQSEERFKSAFQHSPIGMALISPEGRWLQVNAKICSIVGYAENELLTKTFQDITHPDDLELDLDYVRRMLAGEIETYKMEKRYFHKEGKVVWVLLAVALVKDNAGMPLYFISQIEDITERKQAEEALRRSEEDFHSLAESMPQIVWVTRPDGWNIYFNQRWVDYTGLTLEESYGHGWNKPFHPDDQQRAWDAWQNATQHGATYSLECRLRRADGAYRWWLIRGVPLLDKQGGILKWFGTCTDIEDIKRAEEEVLQLNASLEQRVEERTSELRDAQEQLVRQEKLALLGQVAGSMGHELRNPLGVISNAVYFLKMTQPDVPAKVTEYLDLIQANVSFSSKIIADLLDFAQSKPANRAPVSVPEALRQTLESFPAPASVRVVLDLPADLPQAYADARHLIQIFSNVILNACQAMPTGGTLTVAASVRVGMLCVAVRDEGVGISPENMAKLFDPLFTTKPQGIGLGLGLAICRKLIEANNGRIEVKSEGVPGKGSTFAVWLPVYAAQA